MSFRSTAVSAQKVIYPAPILLTDKDQDAVISLLEKHVEGRLQHQELRAFFEARASQKMPAKPIHPAAVGHSYGHWGTDDNATEVFAHDQGTLSIYVGSNKPFLIARPDYQGAVWVDRDASTGAIDFTALGMPDDAFAAFPYDSVASVRPAIDHQITGHVAGQCSHDHLVSFRLALKR